MSGLLFTLLLGAPLIAHPFHASRAEVDYRAECRCLEVALSVPPEDLEDLIARRIGQRIALESPAVDAALLGYLVERFVVTVGAAKSKIEWVGKEVDPANAWLYFKVLDVPTKFELAVRLFFEREPTQVNQVLVRYERDKIALTFRTDRPKIAVDLENP